MSSDAHALNERTPTLFIDKKDCVNVFALSYGTEGRLRGHGVMSPVSGPLPAVLRSV